MKEFGAKFSNLFETPIRISDMFKPLTDTISANLKLLQPNFEEMRKAFSSLPQLNSNETNEDDSDSYNKDKNDDEDDE